MSTVPKGWRCAALADVCEVVSGGTPRTGVAAYWDGDIPWLTPKDLALDKSQVVHGGARSITGEGLANSSAKLFPAGSVIVSSRAPIGYVAIAGEQMSTNQGCKIAVPPPEIDSRYLYWFMLQARDDMEARASGTTFKEISGKEFGRTRLRWPKLSEQRRIVEILEDHLSRLDFADRLVREGRLKGSVLLRSLLLQAAVGWGLGGSQVDVPNLEGVDWGGPREPLVQLPEGWRWQKWREVGTSQNGRAFPSSDYQADGVRLLRPGNLGMHGFLEWRSSATRALPVRYLDSHSDLLIHLGDVVMNLTAQSLKDDFLGRVCLVRGDDAALLNQRLARLVPKTVSSEFATIVFRSPIFRTYVSSLNTGSLIQHMFTKQIAEFWFPIPPAADEERVLARFDEHAGAWGRLANELDPVPARTQGTRRALLAAAFAGRLTA